MLFGEQDGSSPLGTLCGAQIDREYGDGDVQCAQVLLAIGEDRSKEFPGVSHLPPIVSRDLKDGAEALTALELWMMCLVLKVQVKVEEKMFDYVLKLQCLRH